MICGYSRCDGRNCEIRVDALDVKEQRCEE
jgi:hypothetical protein